MHINLHLKFLLFLTNFNRIRSGFTNFSKILRCQILYNSFRRLSKRYINTKRLIYIYMCYLPTKLSSDGSLVFTNEPKNKYTFRTAGSSLLCPVQKYDLKKMLFISRRPFYHSRFQALY